LERPKTKAKKVKISFTPAQRSSRGLVWTENLSKGFGEYTLFENVNFFLERYDRVGLIGPNGSGKTTFLKMLLGKEKPTSGEVKIGGNLDVGYYDQEHEGLDLESSVLDEVWKIKPQLLASDLRSFLAKFLFFGEDVFRKIRTFSGGEQSRVVLAKLILSHPNFLILDEPTNHLDIASREVLENALSEFGGTILVVSHDRYFLNKAVNRIYAIESKTLKEYLGNYTSFEEKKKEEKEALEKSFKLKKQEKKIKEKVKKAKPKIKKRSLHQIEKEISEIDQKIEEIDYLLSTEEVYTDWQNLLELNEERKMLSQRLDELLAEWERSAEA
jgi:ATP-binding cassette subfamily F protein 3